MANVRVLASGLEFPEGPVVMPDGSVVLVEIRGRRLTRVWPDGRKETVAEIPGGPNGAALGPDGKMCVCNNGGFSWVPSRGTMMPGEGTQLKPPLLQTYILPSGPSAAPLGPPGISATVSLRPSGHTRVSRRPRISTSTTEPSGMTTGPSGNSSPLARTRTFAIKSSRFYWPQADPIRSRTRNMLFARCYGKVAAGCQPEAAQGGCAEYQPVQQPMPSSPAKAGDPVFQSVCVRHRRSGILGRPVEPGDDD